MRMLYQQRAAYLRMSRPRRAVHRFLWAIYPWVWDWPIARLIWGQYRRIWP